MQPIIEVKDATVILDGAKILKDISWRVMPGEDWFVLGPNGAGKTTLVKMLMGYVWPLYGAEVSVLGQRYGAANLPELRKRIAWVSPYLQNSISPRWTALEIALSGLDAAMGLFREATAREKKHALEIMEDIDCAKLADHEFGKTSSGEQLKILIARALVTKPDLMILDEACAHLDMRAREFFLGSVEKLIRRKKVSSAVFITHRTEDIPPVFTNGLLLKDGQICAAGPAAQIMTNDSLTGLFGLPVTVSADKHGRFWARPV